jgi:subfamily B ATP-binding cassette protein MsbA
VNSATFRRVLGFGRQYFDRNAIGRIDAEISWSNSAIGLLIAVAEVLRYGVGLVVKAGVMVAISIPLSIAFIVTLPFVNWFMQTINRSVERISARGVEVDRRMRGQVLDILGSIPLVKAYSQEAAASSSYSAILDEARDVAVRRDRVVSLRYPVEEVVILIVMLFVQGAVIFIEGDFRPGDLAAFGAFLLVLQQALPDYKYLSLFSLKVSEEVPRLEAVADLFVDDGKFVVPSGPERFDGLREGIAIQDLSFQYDKGIDTIRGIDTWIPAGKTTAIVGHSGAGKTTFVDLIARLYDCAPSSILFDGRDVRSFSLESLHRSMAIVSQEVWLLNRSMRDNLVFGLDRSVSDEDLWVALRDVDLADFVEGLLDGLDTEVGEATSALDSVVEQRVARAIQDRVHGHTLIVIAHRLSTIRDADVVLVMDGGRLVEQGRWDELVTRGGTFTRLHDAQLGAEAQTPATA